MKYYGVFYLRNFSYLLTRTWNATDECGNETLHIQYINVQDITHPIFNEVLPLNATKGANTHLVNIISLKPGIYNVSIISGNEVKTLNLIKIK